MGRANIKEADLFSTTLFKAEDAPDKAGE